MNHTSFFFFGWLWNENNKKKHGWQRYRIENIFFSIPCCCCFHFIKEMCVCVFGILWLMFGFGYVIFFLCFTGITVFFSIRLPDYFSSLVSTLLLFHTIYVYVIIIRSNDSIIFSFKHMSRCVCVCVDKKNRVHSTKIMYVIHNSIQFSHLHTHTQTNYVSVIYLDSKQEKKRIMFTASYCYSGQIFLLYSSFFLLAIIHLVFFWFFKNTKKTK